MAWWLPTFMTEVPGYIFASVGYAFLGQGFGQRSFRRSLFGFAFGILALGARAGAILVVPFLGVYLICFFGRTRAEAIRRALAVSVVTIVMLSLGSLLLLCVGPPGYEHQGPLAYTLYGIARGGQGWDYVFQEHPEIWQIAGEGARARYAYGLFWQQFHAAPGTFFATLFHVFLFNLKNAAPVFFGLVEGVPPLLPALLALITLVLVFPATWKRQGPWAFLPVIALGVLLSSPFLYTIGFRVYMATLPFQLALSAIALPLLIDRARAWPSRGRTVAPKQWAIRPPRTRRRFPPHLL
jgi:hypothetical protein